MPDLETARLLIRPFVMDDLADVHRLFDVELVASHLRAKALDALAERARWLQWSVLNYEQLARMHQPPYGDRAVILQSSGRIIGSCGFVPCLNAFEQLPGFYTGGTLVKEGRYSTEFGLYYAISPDHWRQGYASEAAQALVDYAFQHLRLKRVVATTDHDNWGSMGVMARLGMRIEKNSQPHPPWLQVVGILENKT